jgi:haloalkane dehalogenase
MTSELSASSHFVSVLGSRIHYQDEGKGDPILFLHGVPASSYLWRNVIPHAAKSGRCIAPDLIGLGQSDKPDIEYTTEDHIRYMNAFIEALGLKNITLVMHDWGSVIGLDYAMRHPENVKSVVVLEGYLHAGSDWNTLSLPLQQVVAEVKSFVSEKVVDMMAMANYFFDRIFPNYVLHKLSAREMERYRAFLKTPQCAKPLLQYFKELPSGKNDVVSKKIIQRYSSKLVQSSMPKLMFYAIPGFNTTVDTLIWAKDHLKNLVQIDLGDGLHYLPETHPEIIGQKIAEWHAGVKS